MSDVNFGASIPRFTFIRAITFTRSSCNKVVFGFKDLDCLVQANRFHESVVIRVMGTEGPTLRLI